MPYPAEFHELAQKVSNWGRWGDDDELGTINLITPDVVRRGAACVKTGKTFSLALPLEEDGPQIGMIPGRENPKRTMIAVNMSTFGDPEGFHTSDDAVTMGLQAATHWDSLAHASFKGQVYNGYPWDVITDEGAQKCGIGNMRKIVSRGILLDIARTKGVDCLPVPYAVTGDDLDAACEAAGVTVEPGDIVLVRTGLMQAFLKQGQKEAYHAGTGPSFHSVQWFRDHDVAAVATDTITFEYLNMEEDLASGMALPVHVLHLVFMGMTQGQNWDLDELAADCADDGVYQFFLEASPEPFVHGLGSPVNPITVK
jgi:kynurenine formamidase